MPKLIVTMKRKAGTTHHDFRQYYESKHAPFAVKCFGSYFASYRRNYPYDEFSGNYDDSHALKSPDTPGRSAREFSYDVLMEIWFDTQADMDKMYKALEGVKTEMAADEDMFIDRNSLRIFVVDEVLSKLPG
jgi:hypothetical protein